MNQRAAQPAPAHPHLFSGDNILEERETILARVKYVQNQYVGYPIDKSPQQLAVIIDDGAPPAYVHAAKYLLRQRIEKPGGKFHELALKTNTPVLALGAAFNPYTQTGTDVAELLATAYHVGDANTVSHIGERGALWEQLQEGADYFGWQLRETGDVTFLTHHGEHNVKEASLEEAVKLVASTDVSGRLVIPHFRQPALGRALSEYTSYDPMLPAIMRATILEYMLRKLQ